MAVQSILEELSLMKYVYVPTQTPSLSPSSLLSPSLSHLFLPSPFSLSHLSLPPSLPPSLPFLPSSLVYTQVERQTNEMFEQMRGELEQVEEDLVHSRALREKEARESMQQRQEDRQKAEKEVGSSVVAKLASR